LASQEGLLVSKCGNIKVILIGFVITLQEI